MNTKEKKMSNLEKLYGYMYLLDDNWNDYTPEIKAASDRIEKAMGDELYIKYEDEIMDYVYKSNKEGFIQGFQYAVSLLTSGKAVQNEILL